MNGTTSLQTFDLSIGYRRNPIASAINICLHPGELTALLGPNGVGKSTLLKTLTGELPPLGGNIKLMGNDLASYSHRQLSRLMAIVTTDSIQAGGLTVEELVALGRHPYTGFFGRLGKEDREAVEQAMHCVGIDHKSSSYISELSDGERQKALIAKAIARDTPVIVLDEPFSFLDVASRIEILERLDMLASSGKTILFSSHDVSQALRMASRLILFTPKREIITGTPRELMDSGALDNLFDTDKAVFSRQEHDFVVKKDKGLTTFR